MVPEQTVVKRPVPEGARDLGLTDQVWIAKCQECGQEIPYDDRAFEDREVSYQMAELLQEHGLLAERAEWSEREIEVRKLDGGHGTYSYAANHFEHAVRAEMEKGNLGTAAELCSRAIWWRERALDFVRMHWAKVRAEGVLSASEASDLGDRFVRSSEEKLVQSQALANEIARQQGEAEPYDLQPQSEAAEPKSGCLGAAALCFLLLFGICLLCKLAL